MYRFLLTPRWWGINVFVVLAIPVCLFMGSWQLGRFESRVDTHEDQRRVVDEAADATAEPLDDLLPIDQRTVGRTAEVTGRYDADRTLLVPDRRLDDQSGFYVLDLLFPRGDEPAKRGADDAGSADSAPESAESDHDGEGAGAEGAGKALPVVRGWLPGAPDADRVPAPPSGEVTVTGVLQAVESHNSPGVGASGSLPRGQLGFISAASLVNVVPYDVHNAWITVQRTPKGSPLKPVPPVAADNTGLDMKAFQNLGYTAEWFAFAGFVLFMWFRLFRREAELARDIELGLVPDPSTDPPEPSPTGAPATGTSGSGTSTGAPVDGTSGTSGDSAETTGVR
ncbi:SURF1 family protein [Streptomyces sp. AJS327]|uniref:SURF1 family protein n=1 Tax=Streptomyces sp. AJS327 TaxID=2545265 RepID=UPI0015DE5BCF|nr:SURF1 family protein [Streptomyces sp. AJS327]MBA0052632.1 SURF1 family protein [Streptomyces sp. AJS327]